MKLQETMSFFLGENKNKREVDMTMTFNENLGFQFEKFISNDIVLNGIQGVQAIQNAAIGWDGFIKSVLEER